MLRIHPIGRSQVPLNGLNRHHSAMDEGDSDACDYCGSATGDVDWLSLEVARPQPDDPTGSQYHDYVALVFCSPTHAGFYLQEGRLPPVAPPPLPAPLSRWERAQGWLIGITLAACILWTLFIFGLGAWTFVRHLRGS